MQKAYRKQERATKKEYKSTTWALRNKTGKTKAHLELKQVRDIKSSKRELCKFRGNMGMFLNGGDNLVVVQMEKAEVLNTFLPQTSQAKITPRFPGVPGWFGKEQVRDNKLGMS